MDSLQEWPEPIVRVQSLAHSGLTTIPDRYVKPPSDRPTPATDGIALKPIDIPTIDLGGLVGGSIFECRTTINAVSNACKEWGFFQVVNHGISSELMNKMMELWREFFHLPMEHKQRYASSPKTYEGYGSRLGVEKGAILDWGDFFYLHLLPQCLKDPNKWPSLPTNCRDTIKEYNQEVTRLCHILMKVLSMGLGLDVDRLQEGFGGHDLGTCLRVNFYPKCPQPELTLGLSAHSDPGGLTVLLPDDKVAGLQVRKGDGWVTVQPVKGALIVNIGDQIQVLSNAIYKSVEHRVVVNSDLERLSIAFFCNPKGDIQVGPLKELTALGEPPLYLPMTFNEYRLYIRSKGIRGKSQVNSLEVV